MKYALFWSGGKDSLLALDRARRAGLDVTHLVNIYEGNSGRVRFHGVRRGFIRTQADALGMSLVQKHTHPENFEQALAAALVDLSAAGIGGIVFGNIHLADIRAWYEERTKGAGFEHVEPLWGDPPAVLIREFVERGHHARIVSVNLSCGRAEWLGRDFDAVLIADLEAAAPADVCGERGEYHSYAYGGPLFRAPLQIAEEGRLEMEGHLVLDFSASAPLARILQAKLEEQVERAEHLVSLIPEGKLDWRPEMKVLTIRELMEHMKACLAGFCAALHALHPERLAHYQKLREPGAPKTLRVYMDHIAEGLAFVSDEELACPIPTVFVPEGEPLLTLLLGNLEHFINHKYQLFFYLKMVGVSVGTPDLYELRGR
jgi:uncharacterized protein (TIGR00290 family)